MGRAFDSSGTRASSVGQTALYPFEPGSKILRFRDATAGVPVERQKKRVDALHRLFELFDGHDVDAEIARLKAEDDGF